MTEENKNTTPEETKSEDTGKSKFVFHCTQCGWCCENRGPIPITFWDLEMWAKKGVLDNFLPNLKVYRTSKGGYDLILAPLKFDPFKKLIEQQQELMKQMEKAKAEEQESDSDVTPDEKEEEPEPVETEEVEEEKEEPDIDEIRCPYFNLEKRECLVYEYRPLSCRTYPLEFDGKGFNIVDEENCEGIGQGPMSKEDLKEMRVNAKKAHKEMSTMQISIPVLYNVLQKDEMLRQMIRYEVLTDYVQQQQEMQKKVMEGMSPEDKEKLDEIMKKNQPSPEDTTPPPEGEKEEEN